jgi:exodeoxyribonuclease VII large subunit
VQQLQRRLLQSWGRQSADAAWRIRELSQQLRLGAPDIESQLQRQQSLAQRLTRALHEQLRIAQDRTNRLQSDLLHLNPQRVLERGYSITTQLDGTIVRDAEQLADVESLRLTLAQGWAQVKVESTGQ